MSGLSWAAIACIVARGTRLRFVNSTESPERAAQAAAGIAYGACSPEATITCGDGLPRIAVKKRSTAAAVAYGSVPVILPLFIPDGADGLVPMRMTCASRAKSAPTGLRRSIASEVAAGSLSPSLARSGAPSGCAFSTEPATAPCQSFLSTSTTACGRSLGVVAGNTAAATPARSATGSPPPTRIVLRVATAGEPSFYAACPWVDVGAGPLVARLALPVVGVSPPPIEQPLRTIARSSGTYRRIGGRD